MSSDSKALEMFLNEERERIETLIRMSIEERNRLDGITKDADCSELSWYFKGYKDAMDYSIRAHQVFDEPQAAFDTCQVSITDRFGGAE